MKKKIVSLFLLVVSLVTLFACQSQFNVYFYVNDDLVEQVVVNRGEKVSYVEYEENPSSVFFGWYTGEDFEIEFDFDTEIRSDLSIYGRYEQDYCRIKFVTNCDEEVNDLIVPRKGTVTFPEVTKKYYKLVGWYEDDSFSKLFNAEEKVTRAKTLYAKWEIDEEYSYIINYVVDGTNLFPNKDELYKSFYGDFYDFLINETDCYMDDFENKNAFLVNCKTWSVGGRSDMYHVGDRFARYFLTQEENGRPENQPTNTFIGYVYQQGKYHDFIDHLMTFFAYWRTDEGYSQSDIHGNDFFYSAWAALVDTSKFFFFTADTLNTKYAWFKSERVKYALDHIPGVVSGLKSVGYKFENYNLNGSISIDGYEILGFYTDREFKNKIDVIYKNNVDSEITIYIKVKKVD